MRSKKHLGTKEAGIGFQGKKRGRISQNERHSMGNQILTDDEHRATKHSVIGAVIFRCFGDPKTKIPGI